MCFICPECHCTATVAGACAQCGFQLEADAHSQEIAIEWVRDTNGDRKTLIAIYTLLDRASSCDDNWRAMAADEALDLVEQRLREVGYLRPGPLSVEGEGDALADEDRIERRAA